MTVKEREMLQMYSAGWQRGELADKGRLRAVGQKHGL